MIIGSPVEQIKNRLDIVDVVGSYIKLSRCGQNYRALCPFHKEKKPSFFVSPSRQFFKCFGCGVSGDIFKFVMQIENIEFYDALKILAQKAGIELKPIKPEIKTETQRMYEICELACQFFETQLKKTKKGQKIKKYLLDRGINESSIKKWRIGYAPSSWDGLMNFLVSKGYEKEEIERAGLIIKKEFSLEKQNYYDRFRQRIIFPVFDLNSKVVGFGGRVLPHQKEEVAKYINTPNTLIYNKSQVLYGLNYAKQKIRENNQCVLVEGYTDVILAHQKGFENVVSLSGTALNPFQLKVLKRYTNNLLTAFDMDIAGDMATKRGIDLAQAEGFEIKVVLMPKEKDPADILAQDPVLFDELLKKAKPIMEYYFETTFEKFPKKEEYTLEEKKEISKILLPAIKKIPNKIEQSFWVQKLAEKINTFQEAVFSELQKINLEKIEIQEDQEILTPPLSRKELLEEKILSLLFQLKDFEILEEFKKEVLPCFGEENQRVFWAILHKVFPRDLEEKIASLQLQAEIYPEKDPRNEFILCQKEIKKICFKKELSLLSQKIKKAKKEKKEKELRSLLEQFNEISKNLSNLL